MFCSPSGCSGQGTFLTLTLCSTCLKQNNILMFENIKIRHRNEKKIKFILCSFSINLNCLKFKKNLIWLKSFLYLLLFIMLCIGFLQTFVKSAHSENKTGTSICSGLKGHDTDKKKKSTNKLLLSTKSVDVMKQCLAQATATIN